MKRKILSALFVMFMLSSLALLAGCGGITYEMKASNRAQKYITDKYGFSADVTEVLLSGNSWLEFSWEAPLFAHVGMKHDGKDFTVLVPVRNDDPGFLCDNYEADIICADIENRVREQLKCDCAAFRIDYASSYGNHLLPRDIRSADDLKKSSDSKTVTVFAHDPDPKNAEVIDPSVYGENTNFSIVGWADTQLPEVPYGLIRDLPEQCGWNVSDIYFTQNDGSWAHIAFDRIAADNICLVMPSECGAVLEPAEGPENPGDVPVTQWYRIKSTGEGYGALYAAVGAAPDEEYCIEYEHKGKAYYMRMPHTDGADPAYELCSPRYCDGRGTEFVFRVVKRDFYGGEGS